MPTEIFGKKRFQRHSGVQGIRDAALTPRAHRGRRRRRAGGDPRRGHKSPQGGRVSERLSEARPIQPRSARGREGVRERGGERTAVPPSGESAGRGWCEEPHFNEGRANANHCNRQQQQKGEAAAARAPQQRSPAGGGVTKASEPLSAAAPAIAAGWSPGGEGGSCRSSAASELAPLPPPSQLAQPAAPRERSSRRAADIR